MRDPRVIALVGLDGDPLVVGVLLLGQAARVQHGARRADPHARDEYLRQFLCGVHLTRRAPVHAHQVTNRHRRGPFIVSPCPVSLGGPSSSRHTRPHTRHTDRMAACPTGEAMVVDRGGRGEGASVTRRRRHCAR